MGRGHVRMWVAKGITGFYGKRGDVDHDFWACLEDHEEHAYRTGDPVKFQLVIELRCIRYDAVGVWKLCNIGDSLEHRVPLVSLVEIEPLEE